MNKLILFIGLFAYLAMAQVTVETDDAVIISADSAEASDVNTRLFTNDANTNNNIASGLLGVGLGVGGVLLVQAFQEAEENKKRCNPYYQQRQKRQDDPVMGRLFGLGGGNRPPKPCPPRYPGGPYPAPPHHHHGGPYRPPPNNYQQPQPYPNQGYAPNYPAPSYPNSGYRQPPARPQNNYPTPAYNTPRQPAPAAPIYTPTPSYPSRPQQNAPYRPPNQGYAPAFNGRSLAETEVKEVEKSSGTGSLLGGAKSDRVIFGDK